MSLLQLSEDVLSIIFHLLPGIDGCNFALLSHSFYEITQKNDENQSHLRRCTLTLDLPCCELDNLTVKRLGLRGYEFSVSVKVEAKQNRPREGVRMPVEEREEESMPDWSHELGGMAPRRKQKKERKVYPMTQWTETVECDFRCVAPIRTVLEIDHQKEQFSVPGLSGLARLIVQKEDYMSDAPPPGKLTLRGRWEGKTPSHPTHVMTVENVPTTTEGAFHLTYRYDFLGDKINLAPMGSVRPFPQFVFPVTLRTDVHSQMKAVTKYFQGRREEGLKVSKFERVGIACGADHIQETCVLEDLKEILGEKEGEGEGEDEDDDRGDETVTTDVVLQTPTPLFLQSPSTSSSSPIPLDSVDAMIHRHTWMWNFKPKPSRMLLLSTDDLSVVGASKEISAPEYEGTYGCKCSDKVVVMKDHEDEDVMVFGIDKGDIAVMSLQGTGELQRIIRGVWEQDPKIANMPTPPNVIRCPSDSGGLVFCVTKEMTAPTVVLFRVCPSEGGEDPGMVQRLYRFDSSSSARGICLEGSNAFIVARRTMNGRILTWDMRTLQVTNDVESSGCPRIRAVSAVDENTFLVGGEEVIGFWDYRTMTEPVVNIPVPPGFKKFGNNAKFAVAGMKFAFPLKDGSVPVWDLRNPSASAPIKHRGYSGRLFRPHGHGFLQAYQMIARMEPLGVDREPRFVSYADGGYCSAGTLAVWDLEMKVYAIRPGNRCLRMIVPEDGRR